jgi:hypothetical protein
MHGLLVLYRCYRRARCYPDQKSYPSCLEAKDDTSLNAFLLVSLLHSESGYNTPIANATAAVAAKRILYCTLSGRRPKKKKIPLALRMASRLKRLARFSPHCGTVQSRELRSKPDVNLSAIGPHLINGNKYHDQQMRRVKFFGEPPEAVVTATQRGNGSFAPPPYVPSSCARDRYRGPQK